MGKKKFKRPYRPIGNTTSDKAETVSGFDKYDPMEDMTEQQAESVIQLFRSVPEDHSIVQSIAHIIARQDDSKIPHILKSINNIFQKYLKEDETAADETGSANEAEDGDELYGI